MNLKNGYYDVFIQTCAKYPSNIAIRNYNNGTFQQYTYSEVYGVCEYISQNLQQLIFSKGVIGLVSERNVIIPSVIAAAHKNSTSFMFLNPSQDIQAITSKVNIKVLITITESDNNTEIDILGQQPEKTITIFNLVVSFYNLEQDVSHHKLIHRYFPEHSYIAMTSGSTGEPKHIQVPIQCIQPNIDDLTKMFEITPSDIIYFSTPLTFDPSMIEILLACKNGASLLIAPEKAEILFSENNENSITFWQTTPSKFFLYSNEDIKNKILSANSALKILALGGEPLKGVNRLRELKDINNKTKLFTLYGVTEMSCWACAAEIDLKKILNDREVPLGNCLSETQIVVETNNKNKNTGKIVLVSKTRKCIILNKSVGTEEESSLKFIDTGDIAEIKNGNIYYRGRTDDVIKRFGHKVSLQEIETTIMMCPKVKTCSCIWLPKPMLLVVYFSSESLSSQELSDFLKCKLDDKHWPDKIINVESLPANPHGKTSKEMLSQMFEHSSQFPLTLDSLRELFLKELKVSLNKNCTYDEIKGNDFFSVGGTSFLAVLLCNKLSMVCPQFGKCILPYLISHKHKIDDIMQLALKELGISEIMPKKGIKRLRSCKKSVPSGSQSPKKAMEILNLDSPIEFIVLWTFDTGKCVDASPSLFQHESNLYLAVGSHSGLVVVFDARSGITQGSIKLKSRVEASVLFYNEAPLTMPCGIVGTYNGTITCFTLDSCKEIWRINIGSMIKSRGICCKGFLYIASYDGNIRCIDVITGDVRQIIQVTDQAISANLVLAKNEFILLGTLSGVCACVHTETKLVVWRRTLGSPVFAAPVLYGADEYVVIAEVNGEIHCRTVEKGIKIWNYQSAKGNIFSSFCIREIDKLKWQMTFGCHDNKVYSICVKNVEPSLIWKTQVSSPVYSTPCILSDKLLLAASNNGILYIMDSDTGKILTEYHMPNETFSTPAVYGDYIFIGCRNDHVYCIKCVINI